MHRNKISDTQDVNNCKRAAGEKIIYLEVLRVIAIFGALFVHTGYEGVFRYLETDNRIEYWCGNFFVSVSQYCIPLFFMISGTLLLKREESISYVYKHRVLKMVIVTLMVTLMQYVWNCFMHPEIPFSWRIYLQTVFEGSAAGQHWFLYTYISFLLVLPFLQLLVKNIPDKRWYLYIFGAWGIVKIAFPVIQHLFVWGEAQVELLMFSNEIVYALMGYYIEYHSSDVFYKKRYISALLCVSLILVSASMYFNYISSSQEKHIVVGSLFSPIYSLVIFVIVRCLCRLHNMPYAAKSFFGFAGAGVFGVYLLEGILRDIFYPIYTNMNGIIGSYGATFVWIAVSVLVGIIVSNLFKKVPFIGKLI